MANLEPASLPERHQERFLMSRPQRLGILPTLWFWRDVRTDKPVVGMVTGLFTGVFAMLVGRMLLVAGVSLPLAFVAALFLPTLGLGIIERGLRRMVIRRRRALVRGMSAGELPPCDSE